MLTGYPSSPSPNTQNSVGSEKALRVRGVKKGGKERGRNRKVVMIKVLGHTILRHDRAILKIKAKANRLRQGRLPNAGSPCRQQSGSLTPLRIPLLETGLQHEMMKM